MSTDGPARKARQAGRAPGGGRWAAQPDEAERRGERAHTVAELAETVARLEAIAQVETEVASTLRAMAGRDGTEAAARRLKLAEEAIRGAHEAADRSRRLQRQSRRWQEHADVITLHRELRHAADVLAELARTEKSIADTLISLAGRDGSGVAGQRRALAAEAMAGARHAGARAQALQRLARAEAARATPR